MNQRLILKKISLITLILGAVIVVLSSIIYLLPAGAITKRSPVTLILDYPLSVSFISFTGSSIHPEHSEPECQEHCKTEGDVAPGERKYQAITHNYRPPQIMVFKGKVSHPISGFTYSFDARNVERLDSSLTFFLTRTKEDQIAPLTALFSVNWKVEGKRQDGSKLVLDRGDFKGRLTEGLNSKIPREDKKINGKTKMGVDFNSLNSKLGGDEKGWYELEMKARTNYTFLSQNGQRVRGKANHTIARAKANYSQGVPSKINLYYPLKSLTKTVIISHPILIKLKRNILVVAGLGGILFGVSLVLYLVLGIPKKHRKALIAT